MGAHSGGGDPAAQEVADAALQPLVECRTGGVQHAALKELTPGIIGQVTLKKELRTMGATGDHTKARKALGAAVTLAESRDPLWPTQTSGCSLPLHHCGGLPRLGCSSQSQEEMGEAWLGYAHLEQTWALCRHMNWFPVQLRQTGIGFPN